ncbi:hypothetical protein ACFLSS_00820 [Bacteroidota bacterium]
MKIVFIILSFLITIQANNYGQSKNKFTVFMSYAIDDSVKDGNLAKSYLERELRSLGDVELVGDYSNESTWFAIVIHLAAIIDEADAIIGYAIFAVYTIGDQYSFDNLLFPPYYFNSNWAMGGKDDLKIIASEIIADFEKQVLNEYR